MPKELPSTVSKEEYAAQITVLDWLISQCSDPIVKGWLCWQLEQVKMVGGVYRK